MRKKGGGRKKDLKWNLRNKEEALCEFFMEEEGGGRMKIYDPKWIGGGNGRRLIIIHSKSEIWMLLELLGAYVFLWKGKIVFGFYWYINPFEINIWIVFQ